MKKFILLTIIIVLVLPFFSIGPVVAGPLDTGLQNAALEAGLPSEYPGKTGADQSLIAIVLKYVGVGLSYLGILFMIMVLYAGITWMTAGGNAENTKKAQRTLIHASIGLAVTLMSYSITVFILNQFKLNVFK